MKQTQRQSIQSKNVSGEQVPTRIWPQRINKVSGKAKQGKYFKVYAYLTLASLVAAPASAWASITGQGAAGAMLWFCLCVVGLFVGCILITSLMSQPGRSRFESRRDREIRNGYLSAGHGSQPDCGASDCGSGGGE